MIVPMKKVHIVILKKDMTSALENLCDLGIIHVEHQASLEDAGLKQVKDDVSIMSEAVDVLQSRADASIKIQPEVCGDCRVKAGIIVSLIDEQNDLKEGLEQKKALIDQYGPWGNFEPADIEALAAQGLHVYLCKIPFGQHIEFPADAAAEVIYKTKDEECVFLVARKKTNLSCKTVPCPPFGLNQMKALCDSYTLEIEETEKKIKETVCYLDQLKEAMTDRREDLKFREIAVGMKKEGELALLKGFCPLQAVSRLEQKAKTERWGTMVEDPSGEDRVPTLVRNPKWMEIIKPVFTLINVFPGYRELDISFVFLVFFSMFFGILVGDAGYGLLILGITFFFHLRFKKKIKDQAPFILFYVLSGCAVIWGILTGTFFGTLLFGGVIKAAVPQLTGAKTVQLICFMIGAVHLTIAHGWRLLMKWPAVFSALAELGWIIVLWGAFFLADVMVIGMPFLGVDLNKALMVVGAGAALIVADILSRPKDNIGVGLVLSFFSFISAFTDVVSYIRLFAVGLAGVAVADAFNQMALTVGFNSVAAGLITTLILVVGHLFNIVLCGFGILVHGLRLNVLEFSGHLGLEWAGFKYEPFKRNIEDNAK